MSGASPSAFDQPIRPAQRRAIFAAGKRLGIDQDGIRELTPAGSVSRLTIRQAADLLDRLNGRTPPAAPSGSPNESRASARAAALPRRRPPRLPRGVSRLLTDAQRAKIESLRLELAWSPEGLAAFLAGRRFDHGGKMSEPKSSADGVAIIQLLIHVVAGTHAASARRGDGAPARNQTMAGDRLPADAGPRGAPDALPPPPAPLPGGVAAGARWTNGPAIPRANGQGQTPVDADDPPPTILKFPTDRMGDARRGLTPPPGDDNGPSNAS